MKILPKIIVSFLILVLVIVIYCLPKQVISDTESSIADRNFGSNIIGANFSNTIAGKYGSIEINETETHGYGYIKSRQKEKRGFGLIEFENKLSDSAFVNSLKLKFITDDIKVYNNSGILYALINGNQIYIENRGISEVNGFNGKIDLAIVVNTEGVVDSVIYLSSEETPSYINKIIKTGYFNQYSNLQTSGQHTIDAVAGATITSVAMAKAVNEIFALSQHKILNDYLTGNFSNFNVVAELNKIWIVNLILLIVVFGLLSFKKFRKKKIFIIISIFTVVWLGFYLNSSFTYLLFIKPFTTTSLSFFTIVYILLTLGSTVWFKNTYCKYICPFGNAQRLMFKISPFKKQKAIFKNRHLKIARYVVSIFIVVGYLSGFEILSEYELFPYLFSINIFSVLFGVSVLILLVSMRIPNLWCRALCPTGCILDTVSDISENRLFSKQLKLKSWMN